MDFYKELLEQKNHGEMPILENLEKEDLYLLYVKEGYGDNEIATLFDVDKTQVADLRENWNITVKQAFISDKTTIERIYHKFGTGYQYDYSLYILREKLGIPKFYDLFIPFLQLLKDKKSHNIKEFWKLTNHNYEINERELEYCMSLEEPNLFYRADWCIDALLRAKLIKEVDALEYEITSRGQVLLEECINKNITEFGLGFLSEKYDDFDKDIEFEQKQNISIEKQVLNLELVDDENIEEKKKRKSKKYSGRTEKINFLKINEAKIDFGKKCEEIVYKYEIEKLKRQGREDKAEEVKWVSRDSGDGAGYDIESFEKKNGKYEKIYIEVKGTDKKVTEPFEVTRNEVKASNEYKENYYIYRLGKANTETPQLRIINGSIRENFKLEAVKYIATRRKK